MRDTGFPIVMRGYDRQRVDRYVAEVSELVAELEANQLSESVVQRALEEVGDQTSSILQRARETAGEIEAQSWAKADATVQRAEREAEITRRDADTYAERLAGDARALWEERQRLIEEMRQLADELLGVADDALDRVQPPGTDLAESEYDEDEDEPAAGGTAYAANGDDGTPGARGDVEETSGANGDDDDLGGGDDEELGVEAIDDTLEDHRFDDTTVSEEGVFADEGRPGPEEPSVGEPEPGDDARDNNGTSDEDSDLTAIFERPPAERGPDDPR